MLLLRAPYGDRNHKPDWQAGRFRSFTSRPLRGQKHIPRCSPVSKNLLLRAPYGDRNPDSAKYGSNLFFYFVPLTGTETDRLRKGVKSNVCFYFAPLTGTETSNTRKIMYNRTFYFAPLTGTETYRYYNNRTKI